MARPRAALGVPKKGERTLIAMTSAGCTKNKYTRLGEPVSKIAITLRSPLRPARDVGRRLPRGENISGHGNERHLFFIWVELSLALPLTL